MEQEELEMAASICAAKTLGRKEGKKNAAVNARAMYDCKECFKAGAAWQRNHVWHDESKRPVPGKRIVILSVTGAVISTETELLIRKLFNTFLVKLWAYLDDLLPTSFDDILEANKNDL